MPQKTINNIITDPYTLFDGKSMEDLDEYDKKSLNSSLENSLPLANR